MTLVLRYNVERCSRNGTALYLDRDCHWSTDPDAAWEYSDANDAVLDAINFGGEVLTFRRNARRSDLEFTHDSEAARLAYHYLAAE